jgi:H+/Cl- antiporter ClcA
MGTTQINPVTKRRWIGIAVVLGYWTGFVWVKSLFEIIGVRPQNHQWLVTSLETYYAPVKFLTPKMAPLFGYNFYVIWYAPLVAMLFGIFCFSLIWWFLAPRIKRPNAPRGA